MRLTFLLAVLAFAPTSTLAASIPGYPATNCALADDGASVVVTASNDSATAYQCTVWCKATVTGQHAFTPVTCNFRLGANTADKVKCRQEAPDGATFKAIASQKSTCVPR